MGGGGVRVGWGEVGGVAVRGGEAGRGEAR